MDFKCLLKTFRNLQYCSEEKSTTTLPNIIGLWAWNTNIGSTFLLLEQIQVFLQINPITVVVILLFKWIWSILRFMDDEVDLISS